MPPGAPTDGVNAVPHTPSETLCLDFVNSRFNDHRGSGHVYDRLGVPAWWSWLVERWALEGVAAPSPAEVATLRQVRRQCRRLLEEPSSPDKRARAALNRVLGAAPVTWHIAAEGEPVDVSLRPVSPGASFLAAAVVVSLVETIRGDRSRIRVCANPDCSFVFRDTSPTGARKWCDAAICGNLVKVRAFRAARRGRE